MTHLRVACVQMQSGVEIAPNIAVASDLIRDAAGQGAQLVATPEMTNLLDIRPGKARPKIVPEADDQTLAAMRALEAEGVTPGAAAFVAGHSLGEYSALAAAGALGVADCARLLRIRGRAMQEAVPVGVGAMAALLGLDFDTARAVAEEAAQGEVCQAANDNDPGQVVVSGHKAAVERAVEIAKARGAKRAVLLPVSAPFHCALMQPAADAMAAALAEVEITAPAVPLVANVRARAVTDPAEIRALLVEQVTGSVRWRESVQFMGGAGVTGIWEIGAGKALSGMVRRIDRAIACRAIATPAEAQDAAASLG